MRPPIILEEAFRSTAAEFGTDSLNKTQYISVMQKIMQENVSLNSEADQELVMTEIVAAYDAAEMSFEE